MPRGVFQGVADQCAHLGGIRRVDREKLEAQLQSPNRHDEAHRIFSGNFRKAPGRAVLTASRAA